MERRHPLKRHRPIASGELSTSSALAAAAVIGIVALTASFLLRKEFGFFASAYVALLAFYSGPLKHVVIVGRSRLSHQARLRLACPPLHQAL